MLIHGRTLTPTFHETASMLQGAARRHVVLLARDAAHAERLQQPQRDVPGKEKLLLKLAPEACGSKQTAKGREGEATSGLPGCFAQRHSGPMPRPLSAKLPPGVAVSRLPPDVDPAPTQDSTYHGTNAAARRPDSARASAPPFSAMGGGGDMLIDFVDTGRFTSILLFFPSFPVL